MRKNKHIRPNMYATILEVDLPDGKTIVIQPIRINFGHNDFDIALAWREKEDE